MLRRRKRWQNDLPTNDLWSANGDNTKCFKTIRELQEFSLSQKNPALFYAICGLKTKLLCQQLTCRELYCAAGNNRHCI